MSGIGMSTRAFPAASSVSKPDTPAGEAAGTSSTYSRVRYQGTAGRWRPASPPAAAQTAPAPALGPSILRKPPPWPGHAPSNLAGYPRVRLQGNGGGMVMPSPATSVAGNRIDWAKVNTRLDRLNDVLNGFDGVAQKVRSAKDHLVHGNPLHATLDVYSGADALMKGLRGVLHLGSEAAMAAGDERAAETLKSMSDTVNSVRRIANGVMTPLRSLHTFADRLADPARTTDQRILDASELVASIMESTGYAVARLDRRDGETLAKTLATAVQALGTAGAFATAAVRHATHAMDALARGDTRRFAQAVLGVMQNSIAYLQLVADYLATELKGKSPALDAISRGFYRVSSDLLAAKSVVDTLAITLRTING